MAKIDFRKLDTYRKSFDGILQVKKHVGSDDDLPVTGAQNGDIYTVGDSNTLYMFNNGEWGTLGSGDGESSEKTAITVRVYQYFFEVDAETGETVTIENPNMEGTLIVKGFDKNGKTLPVREIPFKNTEDDENWEAEVEVEAAIGDTIGIIAKIPEYGASCQFVQKVVGPMTIRVEIYPAGIYELADGYLSLKPTGDVYNGCVVVTEDFAILLPPYQREGWDKYVQWGGFGQQIPFVLKADNSNEAITDFDGALNTAAILSVVNDENCAAKVATIIKDLFYSRFGAFLPSAGILKYLYDHQSEINAFIVRARDWYSPEVEYDLLPSDDGYWTSTDYADEAADTVAAWCVFSDGDDVFSTYRSSNCRVFAVSAFQTFIGPFPARN